MRTALAPFATRGNMAPKGSKGISEDLTATSILSAPPNSQRETLQIPRVRANTGALGELLRAGPSPTTDEWPEAPPPSDPDIDMTVEDRRPTPPAFVVPDVPGKGTATLTLVRGIDAGRVFRLARPRTLIGRGMTVDIQVDDTAVSRCHASVTRCGDDCYEVQDLDSTNGTFVRGMRIRRAHLAPGDRVQLGPNVVLRFALLTDDEGDLQENLFESAVRDGLTGVFNRSTLNRQVVEAVQEARIDACSLSVLMIDLDHFKSINDELGHAAGDEILRAVADKMLHAVRPQDSVARYGGEEFVVLARGTELRDACRLGERLRKAIESVRLPSGDDSAMTTASIGVASLAECELGTATELIQLADERMYTAKRVGRNRVWPPARQGSKP